MTTKHIEELLLEAEDAIEDSDQPSAVDMGGGMSGTLTVETPGRVKVWDIETGEVSYVLSSPDYLRMQLQKVNPETGKRIFTTIKPAIEPFRGSELCPLHMDAPESVEYRRLGFPVCKKSNLRNPGEAERHMRLKHKDSFLMLESLRTRQIEEEERAVRHATIAAFTRPQEPVAAPKKPVQPQQSVEATDTFSQTCDACGEELFSKPNGARVKMMHHKKVCPSANGD